jgi:hypothetical protein
MHFPELISQNPYGESAGGSQYTRKKSHPDSGHSGTSGIRGCFIFLLGCALVPLAFYIADEPDPPVITRCLYWGIGIGALLCICQGIYLLLGHYQEFTPRTFVRELTRLSELGFITLNGAVLELDFDAIAKY